MSNSYQLRRDYPVIEYDPSQPLPVSYVQENWQDYKYDGVETIAWEEGVSRFGSFGAFLKDSAPVGIVVTSFLLNMSIISLNVTFPDEGPVKYFTNPAMLILGAFFVFFAITLHRRVRLAVELKNAADFAVFESVRRYLKGRYGFAPSQWETALSDILISGQSVRAHFTPEYRLVSRVRGGFPILMVCNIDGEAPLLTTY